MNSIVRWLENDWYVLVWRNQLGTYSAAAVRREDFDVDIDEALFECNESNITDAKTPEKALDVLGEKMLEAKRNDQAP